AHEAEQDVLRADVVVSEAERFAQRELEHLLGAGRERDLAGGDLLTGADDPHDLRTDALDGDVEGLEHPRGETLLLAQQPEQDVLGADVVVLEGAGLLLGEDDHLAGSLCESLEHGSSLRLGGCFWRLFDYTKAGCPYFLVLTPCRCRRCADPAEGTPTKPSYPCTRPRCRSP